MSEQRPMGRSRGRSRGMAVQPKREGIPPQNAPPLSLPLSRPGAVSETRPASTEHSLGRALSSVQIGSRQPPAVPAAPVVQPQQETISTGGGDAPGALGRGALRGRRIINPETLYTRPKALATKQGTLGRPIQIQANYFEMLTATDWCLYKYDVAFNVEEDRTVVRKGLLRLHKETLGEYIFDGSTLFTSNRLPQPLELSSKRQSDDVIITMKIRLVGDIAKGDENYLQFFNITMRKCLEYLELQLVGRNFYDARNKVEVQQYKLELWPGYETSIRQHEQAILMCTEIRHKVMRQATVFSLLDDCYKSNPGNYQDRFAAMVIGITVLTDYNNNTYRVDDVDYKVSPLSTFECKGVQLSYKDYYRQKYQINIRNMTQPLLLSKLKPRDRRAGQPEFLYLVPELCRSTGLTDDMRNDKTMMRELANYTRLNPNNRIERLMSFNKRLQDQPKVNQELTQWNMQLDRKLVTLPARVLPTEDIVFGNGAASAGPEADWTRELRFKQMLVMPKLKDWVIVVPNRCTDDAKAFISTIKTSVSKMRFEVADPRPYVLQNDNASSYTVALEEIMSRTNPQLIMCVVTNNRADRYAAIKKKCCIDRPVPTQCILARNLNGKGVASIATKVAVQINCKIGGAPWSVNLPVNGLMVVGFDVCHDTSGKNCDFGALVATLDKGFSRYFSAVTAHHSGEELSNDLASNMCKAVHKYNEANRALPTRIVVYRDGVGEGQISYVYEHEVENLKKKLNALYDAAGAKLQLAYIIVTKRLNTRLFFKGANPPPGTVVDDVITCPNKYDFYIVPQSVKQGSVSPTGFNVISDNVKLDASKLQLLTYKLTHMYFNWSGTVRVPAPCQFAHKLAFLVSNSIHATPSNQLESLLYFL